MRSCLIAIRKLKLSHKLNPENLEFLYNLNFFNKRFSNAWIFFLVREIISSLELCGSKYRPRRKLLRVWWGPLWAISLTCSWCHVRTKGVNGTSCGKWWHLKIGSIVWAAGMLRVWISLAGAGEALHSRTRTAPTSIPSGRSIWMTSARVCRYFHKKSRLWLETMCSYS